MDEEHDDERVAPGVGRHRLAAALVAIVGGAIAGLAAADGAWVVAGGVAGLTAVAAATSLRLGWVRWELTEVRSAGDSLTRRLEWEATHDDLTGLVNRAGLEAATARRMTDGGGDLTAMFVDLDHFKRINDELGHLAGDAVLRVVAQRLRAAFRPEDVVGRPGGDEFLVLLASNPAPDELRHLAVRVIRTLEHAITVGDHVVSISASIGMTTVAAADATLERLVAECDRGLYEAKRRGRGVAVHRSTSRPAV